MKNGLKISMGLGFLTYQVQSFAVNWMPKVSDGDGLHDGSKTIMDLVMDYCKKGMGIVLFVAAIYLLLKFISTISHGIEESKKNEGGSMTVFATYAAMSVIYLSMGLAVGYMATTILTKFSF